MSTAMTATKEPRLVHALPGRMRVHLAGWPHEGHCAVEARLREVPGVHDVQANPLTGNVLIHFDPTATDEPTLLVAVQTLKADGTGPRGEIRPISPAAPRRPRRSRSAPDAGLRLAGDPDVAGPASILQNGRPRLPSPDMADLTLKAAGVAVSLIVADSPLGLILSGAEVVRLFLDVVRLFLTVMGRHGARRRGEVQQDDGLLMLIAPDDARRRGVRAACPGTEGALYAPARRRHRVVGHPAAL